MSENRAQLNFPPECAAQTQTFIAMLTKEDRSPQLCYQSIQDGEIESDGSRRVKPIKFVLPAEVPIADLQQLNQDGYYTNCCLNEFGTFKKAAKNVSRVRGYVVDVDSYVPLSVLSSVVAALGPTMVVLSSAQCPLASDIQTEWSVKAHIYWLYRGSYTWGPDVDSQLVKEFKDIQTFLAIKVQALLAEAGAAEARCDLQLHALSLALRLPGLWHQKNPSAVSLTSLWHCDNEAVLYDPFLADAAVLQMIRAHRKETRIAAAAATGSVLEANHGLGKFGDGTGKESVYLETSEGGRNAALYSFVYGRLLCEKRLTKNEALGAAWIENVKQNKPPLAEGEVVTIVESAWSHFLEWLLSLGDTAPIDSAAARALLLSEAVAGRGSAEQLKEQGIEIDVEVEGDESAHDADGNGIGGREKVKKKSRGRPKSTTISSTGTGRKKRTVGSSTTTATARGSRRSRQTRRSSRESANGSAAK